MSKNITIRLNETTIKKCRHAAVKADKSLPEWIADELVKIVSAHDANKQTAKKRALRRLEKGFSLGGTPLSREDIYAE